MDTISLAIENLVVANRKFRVKNITFSLKQGDIMGLIGRSGSGKSTLMRVLLGLQKQESGSMKLTINGLPSRVSNVVGYSPQRNALYPFLTLEENLFTFGKLYGLKKADIEARINPILDRVKLREFRKRRLTEFSGGMEKRADLAVSMIHKPKILILDEPFTGLDISIQKFIWELLIDLAHSGRIIIITSHLLNDIQRYSNQFGLINSGEFYNTQQIMRALQTGKEKNLEVFLEKLFSADIHPHPEN